MMKLIILSLGLLSAGLALSFLMVINLLNSSFLLGFLAYCTSLAGLVVGVAATIQHSASWKRE